MYFLLILLVIFFSGCSTLPYKHQPEIIQPQLPGTYHIIGSGQTLYRISKAYAVDIKEIMRFNDIKDPNQIGVGERLFIPGARSPLFVEPYQKTSFEPIEQIVGKRQHKVKWRYLTLHHSATIKGNAEAFDRNHRRRKMGGLFYHFVIGNGTDSGDGEIEVGWRWRRQIQVERRGDIQICLVGDFNQEEIREAQFSSLISLLETLMQQYAISIGHIRRHKDISVKITECPGTKFPFQRILAQLRKDTSAE